MSNFWILDEKGQPKPCTAEEWEAGDNIIAQTTLGRFWVSTIFLGIDHAFGTTPVLFETMIFENGEAGDCDRYSTREEAEEGHKSFVAMYWNRLSPMEKAATRIKEVLDGET